MRLDKTSEWEVKMMLGVDYEQLFLIKKNNAYLVHALHANLHPYKIYINF